MLGKLNGVVEEVEFVVVFKVVSRIVVGQKWR